MIPKPCLDFCTFLINRFNVILFGKCNPLQKCDKKISAQGKMYVTNE